MALQSAITIGVVILILELLILANPSLVSSSDPEKVRNIMVIYLLMQATILAALDQTLPALRTGPEGIALLLLGFFVTAVLVIAIPAQILAGFEVLKPVLTGFGFLFGFLFIFIKAFIEEVVFRGILSKVVGGEIQAVLFGLFHLTVLSIGGASITAILFGMFFLAILGYIWWIMSERVGFMSAVGSHVAWNAGAFGLLPKLFGM